MERAYLKCLLILLSNGNRAAKLNDEIHIKTYVTRSEGVTSTRHVEMYHKESAKLIIKSETIWCLLDAHTKKPKRISNAIAAVFNN